ncbi:MAG: SH3 domain-containing protein [Anaerolineales bacterium]|jgi:uncharacterized protein YgiM (DUF1202 family)|nr:SH3 domain-containing protein [Anaerolineales bacterium]
MNRKIIVTIIALVLAAFACSMPGQAPAATPTEQAGGQPDLAATITAQELTLQAPTQTPQPPTETFTPEASPTITLTPTPEVPMASVSVNTNCRSGPGTQFDLIGALNVGQTAEVVGRYQNGAYWIIKNPGSSGNCWLWGNYASVSGNTSSLPEYPSPATPTPYPPPAPTDFEIAITCEPQPGPVLLLNRLNITLTWKDIATNEDGYRIYRDGELIATLGASATSTSDVTSLPRLWIIGNPPPSVEYGIAAFNSAGASARVKKSVSCP